MGMIVASYATPCMPAPTAEELFLAAAMIPATAVPCPESSSGAFDGSAELYARVIRPAEFGMIHINAMVGDGDGDSFSGESARICEIGVDAAQRIQGSDVFEFGVGSVHGGFGCAAVGGAVDVAGDDADAKFGDVGRRTLPLPPPPQADRRPRAQALSAQKPRARSVRAKINGKGMKFPEKLEL